AVPVRTHEHTACEFPGDAVERPDDLAFLRAADADLRASQLPEVERVHGMPELDQDVVSDVDDGADWTYACGLQTGSHPRRRDRVGDVGDGAGVARAKLRVFDPHPEAVVAADRHRCTQRRFRRREWNLKSRRDFSRQTDDAQAVRPVGGDFEVDHVVFDRRDLKTSQPYLLGYF